MQFFFFFALLIAAIAVLFAVQNITPVTITFLFWKFSGSLALILLITLLAGALISFFVSLPNNISIRWAVRNQKRKINELEKRLEEMQAKLLSSAPAESADLKPPTGLDEPRPANPPEPEARLH